MGRTFTKFANTLNKLQKKDRLKFNKGISKNLKKRKTSSRNIFDV